MRNVGMCRHDFLKGSAASVFALGSLSVPAKPAENEVVTPFSFRASEAALNDLKRRLDQTRWPERETAMGWEQGPPLATMRALVDYWRGEYGWRKCEAELHNGPSSRHGWMGSMCTSFTSGRGIRMLCR